MFAAFMDSEKAYDRVDRNRLWDTLRVYGVGGHLLGRIRSFYENANASVHLNGELSESFSVEVGSEAGMSDVTMAVQYLYGWMHKRNESWSGGFRYLARLSVRSVEQPLVVGLFAGDSVVG